jgi:hypothetical protein
MDPATGTFTTMDTYGGSLSDPMRLHKYLFANSNPVMYSDPSGHSASLIETGAVIGIMSILSGSANAIIAEFIYKNNTDISERSTKDLDKCALTAFLTGFTTCLFSCLATFFVCVFAFTVLECLMAAAICSLIAWMLGDIADYNYRNGNEVAGIGLEITQQAFISAEIGFVICGLNGGGIESARMADDYSADSNTSGNGTWKDINEEIDDWYQEQYNILDKNQTTGRPVNRKGVEYPRVIVKDYGEVPFPEGPYTPNNSQTLRKAFTESYKKSFKEWWIGQGRAWPEGKVNIHHIKPLSRGGTNDFNNLVPLVQPEEHQPFTNWWMSYP